MMGVQLNVEYCSRAGSLWIISRVRGMFCDDGIPKCGSESIDAFVEHFLIFCMVICTYCYVGKQACRNDSRLQTVFFRHSKSNDRYKK